MTDVSNLTHIHNFRGSWPQWVADLDNEQFVFVRIRHGEGWIGIGNSAKQASNDASLVVFDEKYEGVSDAIDALVLLKDHGFYYVAPTFDIRLLL